MKIAIAAPSPIPFVHGGAENLWLGLQRYIIEETDHDCELIKIAVKEHSLADLLDSYELFLNLDLTHFDQVITTKYPAWMTQHQNHTVYLQHTLRGLYDTYHFTGLPEKFDFLKHDLNDLKKMIESLKGNLNISQLNEIFLEMQSILANPKLTQLTQFPSPLARTIIHAIDKFALHPDKINSFNAISKTVSFRENYFNSNITPNVLYHPSRFSHFTCRQGEFLFTTSRLDSPKRIELLINSMRLVDARVDLIIAGTGPQEEYLKSIAANDSRIHFVGHLNDEELLDHYSRAIAVPFIPYDEDYGLITIEAMKSGKPVITTHDSGGVTEFVMHNETGLVVPPQEKEIAKAIDELCKNKTKAKDMGEKARLLVSGISWENVASGLLSEPLKKKNYSPPIQKSTKVKLKKAAVAVTFPIYPPLGGGQSRIYSLYKKLAQYFELTIVSLADFGVEAFKGEVAPNLWEVRIPKTERHHLAEQEYSKKVGWIPITDVVAPLIIKETPEYLNQLKAACADADLLIASHPFFFNEIKNSNASLPIYYEAHNVEYLIKKSILPDTPEGLELLEEVKKVEHQAWHQSDLVFACTQADIDSLEDIYGKNTAEARVVPNGVATEGVSYVNRALRNSIKNQVGLANKNTVVFMGSWHDPNLKAIERILEFSKNLPDVLFLVIGSAGLRFINEGISEPNVLFLGAVDEKQKQILLSATDLAINPMEFGSGSNLKVFDYMASGIPIISTAFGMRGVDAQSGTHYIESDINHFVRNLSDYFVSLAKSDEIEVMTEQARKLVEEKYSWQVIAADFLNSVTNNFDNYAKDLRNY